MALPHIVIGSGPAGVSCAAALLAARQPVLMLDGGADLEPIHAQKLVELSTSPLDVWGGEASAFMRDGMQSSVEGIPLKLSYGSDFPYRAMPGAPAIEGEGVNTKFSLGKGGLSAVWGSAVMPYRQHDIANWPITADDLAPHYRKVLEFMPIAEGRDDLEEHFPAFGAAEPMPLSAQADALWRTMQSHRDELRCRNVLFGHSRLAVEVKRCVRCGLCMYGCPYSLIYSTAFTVDAMRANPNFTYAPGNVVQRVEESGDEVRVHAIAGNGEAVVLRGRRAFIGAGVLASASLMLRSLGAYDRPVTLRESHYFLLPMLRLASVAGFERGNLHTLAQMFIEIMDEALSPFTIHLQTYTYNDLFEAPIAQKLGPLRKVFPWKTFLSRLFLFQGYLHSNHSHTTSASLHQRGASDVLQLHATDSPQRAEVIRKLVAKLRSIRGLSGLVPLTPLMRQGEPGRGFHTGSSFPMSAAPQGFESDTFGRTSGLQRVHLIDSSVLPSIPATTITYTVMANAHRIGTLAAQMEGQG